MEIISLNGQWKMRRTDQSTQYPGEVPGSVYKDLLSNKLMEDPFFRDNEYEAMKLSNYDYEYTRSFELSSEQLKYKKLYLLCEGLDTLAQIFINGNDVYSTNNMHRTYKIALTDYIKAGQNDIKVVFFSPLKYIVEKQAECELFMANHPIQGSPHLRKAHYMFGWDWGPALPDMGIWRNISIIGYNYGTIDDVYITQNHYEGHVDLAIRLKSTAFSSSSMKYKVTLYNPDGSEYASTTAVTTPVDSMNITVNSPELWWPNNFGKQPLYTIKIELLNDEEIADSKTMRIGLRTLTVNTSADEWGKAFEFVINGKKIFSMGADYIPEDNILGYCNKERTEKLIKSCVDANFNSIRVWGGGYYPEDYFYDLCDEYGLIVWQDLMYACGVYRFSDDFKENIIEETKDNVKRLRHHASLGLWCGNNEQEAGWETWGWSTKYSPLLKTDYIKQYEVILPELVKELDPNTFYWLSSPSSTGSFFDTNNENQGDMHYWDVWHGKKPFTSYRSIYPRFMSEFGIQSFPELKTIEAFTNPDDRNIFSYVLESHQKSGVGNELILHYISETYKYPNDLDSLLYASQLIQAEGLRYGVEHWRRNRGRCMGAIYWQLNDCWPAPSWSSIDYFGRYKALHYLAKRFFAPVLVSACENGTEVSLHITNETFNDATGILTWALRSSDSAIIKQSRKEIKISALSSKACEYLELSDILNTNELLRDSYLEFGFEVNNEIVSSGTVLFVKSKHFNYQAPELKASISETSEEFIIDVESRKFAKYVELSLKEYDIIFSDNFFDLSAGNTKRIYVQKSDVDSKLSVETLKTQLKLRSIYDTYEKF